MTVRLIDGNGETLAADLTAREIDRLIGAGVNVDAKDNGSGSGGSGSGSDDPVDELVDPDETDGAADASDALDEMDSYDGDDPEADATGDWWDAGDFEDYSSTDEVDEARYEELREKLDASKSDTADWQNQRDRRNARGVRGDRVREILHDDGMVDDFADAFRELTTRDRDYEATTGHSLNIDAVVRHHAGAFAERDFYLNRDPAETGDRAVAVTVDMSGSMYEQDALAAVAAIAEATDIVGDQFAACGYTKGSWGVNTPIITTPDEDFDYDHLDTVGTGGTTPTASGIEKAVELLSHADRPESLVIVVTDGKPNVCLEEGTCGDPTKDATRVVAAANANGIRVIGLGIGNVKEPKMRQMFGDSYVMGDARTLVEDLVEVYRRQMKTVSGAY